MIARLIQFIFFGNYFIGILAIALSVETVIQLHLPYNSVAYYALLFCATVMYYTYAYSGVLFSISADNGRATWYQNHQALVKYSQWILVLICIALGVFILIVHYNNLSQVAIMNWMIVCSIGIAALLYYGLLPSSGLRLNLRNSGWFKAFVIGYEWAACVSLLPIVFLQLEQGHYQADTVVVTWLFIKNWMFCTVNAIMFDMKDYEDDSNKQLKTFVVRYGLRNTILFVLTPLCLVGILFTIIFAKYRHFTMVPFLCNVLPFFFLLLVTYSMAKRKNILFYLIVIDGLVLVKAIFGILGMRFAA